MSTITQTNFHSFRNFFNEVNRHVNDEIINIMNRYLTDIDTLHKKELRIELITNGDYLSTLFFLSLQWNNGEIEETELIKISTLLKLINMRYLSQLPGHVQSTIDRLIHKLRHQKSQNDIIFLLLSDLIENLQNLNSNQNFNKYCELETDDEIELFYYKKILSCEFSSKIGAILSEKNKDIINVFSKFGELIGLLLVLRAEILDIIGNPLITGKRNGLNLIEGRRTFLLHITTENLKFHPRLFDFFIENLGREDEFVLPGMISLTKKYGIPDLLKFMDMKKKEAINTINLVENKIGGYCSLKEMVNYISLFNN